MVLSRVTSGYSKELGDAPLPQNVEVCDLKLAQEKEGVYGIGMKINRENPHAVQLVSALKDKHGNNANSSVQEGDVLVRVDGNVVDTRGINTLERLVLGEAHTVTTLSLRSRQTQQVYNVTVLRHVPIREWEEDHQWLELKPALEGASLGVDSSIVKHLEKIRHLVMTRAQKCIDYQKTEVSEECSLGIVFGTEVLDSGLRGNQIHQMHPGSPAAQCGELQRGDEIVEIDGRQVDHLTVIPAVRGRNSIGTVCTLTVRRTTRQFQVLLHRTSKAAMQAASEVLRHLEKIEEGLRRAGAAPTDLNAVKAARTMVLNNEEDRFQREGRLTNRLNDVQIRVASEVSFAESILHAATVRSGDGLDTLHLQTKATDLEAVNFRLQAEVNSLRVRLVALERGGDASQAQQEELVALRRTLDGMVPRSDIADLEAKVERLTRENARLHQEVTDGVKARNDADLARDEAATLRLMVDRLQREAMDTVPRSLFEQVQTDTAALSAELERARRLLKEMHSDDAMAASLEQTARLKAEVERLNAVVRDSVHSAQHEGVLSELDQTKAALKEHRDKIATMVPRHDLAAADAEIEALSKALSDARERVAEAERQGAQKQRELDDSVPKAKHESATIELRGAEAKIRELDEQLDLLRPEEVRLRSTLGETMSKLEALETAATIMVMRSDKEGADARAQRAVDDEAAASQECARLRLSLSAAQASIVELSAAKDVLETRADASVPKAALDPLREELGIAREELAAKTKEVALIATQAEYDRRSAAELNAEVQRLREAAKDWCSRKELAEAVADAKAARVEVGAKEEALGGMSKQLADLQEEFERPRLQIAELTATLEGMVARDRLLSAESLAAANGLRAVEQGAEVSRLQAEVQRLGSELAEWKEEAAELRTQLADMVLRSALAEAIQGSDQWRERAENAEGASASLEKQLSASEATGKTLAEENVDLREKLTGSATQEQLSEAVKKAGGAEAGQRAAEEEHTHFRTQLLRAQAHVAEAQKEASDLALKLADAVPRAEVSDAKAVEAKTHRDLQEAEFELKASKGAFEDLLNKFVALQEQLRTVTASLPGLAPREDLSKATLKATDALHAAEVWQHTAEQAHTQVADQEARLKNMADAREVAAAQKAAQEAVEALSTLRARLADAGLGDDSVLDDLLGAIMGPVSFPGRDVALLLRILRESTPPVAPQLLAKVIATLSVEAIAELGAAMRVDKRDSSEWCRIIKMISSPTPLSEDEVRRLIGLLRGPPSHTIEEVEERVRCNLKKEDFEELKAENLALRERVRELERQIVGLEAGSCPEPADHAVAGALRKEIDLLKHQLHKLSVPPPPMAFPPACTIFKKQSVRLYTPVRDAEIFATIDGSTPTREHHAFAGFSPLAVVVDPSTSGPITKVRAVCMRPDSGPSEEIVQEYRKEDSELAGIGMLLEQSEHKIGVYVRDCLPGGIAGEDGRIAPGDRLLTVDGVDVDRLDFPDVFQLILGLEGTPVRLELARPLAQADSGVDRYQKYGLDLVRRYNEAMPDIISSNLQSFSPASFASANFKGSPSALGSTPNAPSMYSTPMSANPLQSIIPRRMATSSEQGPAQRRTPPSGPGGLFSQAATSTNRDDGEYFMAL